MIQHYGAIIRDRIQEQHATTLILPFFAAGRNVAYTMSIIAPNCLSATGIGGTKGSTAIAFAVVDDVSRDIMDMPGDSKDSLKSSAAAKSAPLPPAISTKDISSDSFTCKRVVYNDMHFLMVTGAFLSDLDVRESLSHHYCRSAASTASVYTNSMIAAQM